MCAEAFRRFPPKRPPPPLSVDTPAPRAHSARRARGGRRPARSRVSRATPIVMEREDEDARADARARSLGCTRVLDALSTRLHDDTARWVRETLARGRAGELLGKTHAPVPAKWASRGQSREMLQYGTYTHSNRVRDDVEVESMPAALRTVLDALVERGVIGKDEQMDSCTINVYERGMWIPPHIDNPAFARPFVTVSLESEQAMTLGRGMIWPEGGTPASGETCEGEEIRLMLPARSAVRMEGRAADEYEHAIPPVSADRISLTFRRRMDAEKEKEAIEALTCSTEKYRAVYRERRAEIFGSSSESASEKPLTEEQQRRNRIVAERAAIKAAREQRKKEKQLRKEQKRGGDGDDGEVLETASTATTSEATTTAEREALAAIELAKKAPKRACGVVPENLIDSVNRVTVMPEVEREHVQKVYDIVAQQWHGTRYRAWTGVEAFIRKQPASSLVADVGCGNGKNIPEVVKGGSVALGSDFSKGLIDICRETGYEVMVADAVLLPYRSNLFDYALNIAVLHHISSPERRVELVKETMRIVKVGGVALFYAWALEQEQGGVSGHQFEGQDVLVPFHNKIKVKGVSPDEERDRQSRVEGAPTHGEADPEKRSVVYQRYCHVYREGELPRLFDALPWCEVEASYYDHGNWCVEVRKKSSIDAS